MDADRAERLIAAAFRGMMQGILDSEGAPPRSRKPTRKESLHVPPAPADVYPQAPDFTITPQMTASDAEVIAAVRAAMSEAPPIDAGPPDLFGLLERQEATHAEALRMTQPQTQPGPGEDEGRRWPGVD